MELYRKLRQGDAVGQNKQAYRITVRQLEAMIRLSEALARLHLDDEVQPEYVEWAYSLIKKSIVHVKSDNVGFSYEELAPTEETTDDTMSSSRADAVVGDADTSSRKKRYEITFDEYKRVTDLLAMHVRGLEAGQTDEDDGVDPMLRDAGHLEQGVIMQNALVSWYLGQREDISSEEELVRERVLINEIISRLVDTDLVFMEVHLSEEVRAKVAVDDAIPAEERRYLALHPNYVPGYQFLG